MITLERPKAFLTNATYVSLLTRLPGKKLADYPALRFIYLNICFADEFESILRNILLLILI